MLRIEPDGLILSSIVYEDEDGTEEVIGALNRNKRGSLAVAEAFTDWNVKQAYIDQYRPDGGISFRAFPKDDMPKFKPGDQVVALIEHEHNENCERKHVSEYIDAGQLGTVHSNRAASATLWVMWDGGDTRCLVWPQHIAPAPPEADNDN